MSKFFRINAMEEYMTSAYDEEGNGVYCEHCDGELHFKNGEYVCPDCDASMSRSDFFSYIGADLPGSNCYSCDTNYPLCKKQCPHYEIDPNDPILD